MGKVDNVECMDGCCEGGCSCENEPISMNENDPKQEEESNKFAQGKLMEFMCVKRGKAHIFFPVVGGSDEEGIKYSGVAVFTPDLKLKKTTIVGNLDRGEYNFRCPFIEVTMGDLIVTYFGKNPIIRDENLEDCYEVYKIRGTGSRKFDTGLHIVSVFCEIIDKSEYNVTWDKVFLDKIVEGLGIPRNMEGKYFADVPTKN